MSYQNNDEKSDLDILRLLSKREMQKIIEITKKSLPESLRGHNYLLMQLRWMEKKDFNLTNLSPKIQFKIYTHRYGKLENCTYIALSRNEDIIFFAYTLEKSVNELNECFQMSQKIKWDLGPWLWAMETNHLNFAKILIKERQLPIIFEIPNGIYYLSNDEARKYEFDIPDDVEIKNLIAKRDAKKMDDLWPHRNPGSLFYIENLIDLNGGLGIFNKKSGDLLAWALINEMSAIGILQTIESEKRKGYAKLIIKALSKLIAFELNIDILVFIIEVNTPSKLLFSSLNFKKIGTCAWLRLAIK